MKNLLKSEINSVCGGVNSDLTSCDNTNVKCSNALCDFIVGDSNKNTTTIYRLVITSPKSFDQISKKLKDFTTTSKEKISVKCINPNKVPLDIEL